MVKDHKPTRGIALPKALVQIVDERNNILFKTWKATKHSIKKRHISFEVRNKIRFFVEHILRKKGEIIIVLLDGKRERERGKYCLHHLRLNTRKVERELLCEFSVFRRT